MNLNDLAASPLASAALVGFITVISTRWTVGRTIRAESYAKRRMAVAEEVARVISEALETIRNHEDRDNPRARPPDAVLLDVTRLRATTMLYFDREINRQLGLISQSLWVAIDPARHRVTEEPDYNVVREILIDVVRNGGYERHPDRDMLKRVFSSRKK
jgi:hypothetical protein